jgi:hypothetical protein
MNKTITNLSLIANAAEYLDRATSAAWRIRSSLQGMAVWSANAFLSALNSGEARQIFNAATKLATIRTWVRDANKSSLMLDLMPTAVENTLGLNRVKDTHVEAERIARSKCKQARSAKRFKEFYNNALAALDEQEKTRRERVEEIANLLSDNSTTLSAEVRDYASTFQNMDLPSIVEDELLYDDNSVERESDRLNETVGVACESMLDEVEAQYDASIVTKKINTLNGYRKAILSMMEIVGVDSKKLNERRVALEKAINDVAAEVGASSAILDAEMSAQLDEMKSTAPEEVKPKRTRVKAEAAHA